MCRKFGLTILPEPLWDADIGGGSGGNMGDAGTGDTGTGASTGGEVSTGSEEFKIRTLKDVNPFADDPEPEPKPEDPKPEDDPSSNPDPNAGDPNKEGDGGTNQLILGKFKDTDSLATAYQNIQSHSSRVANQNALLIKQVEELTAKLESNQQPQQKTTPPNNDDDSNKDDVSEDEIDSFLNNPAEYKSKLKQEILGEIKSQLAPDLNLVQQIRTSHEETAEWERKAIEVAQAFDPETGEQLYPDFFDLKDEVDQAFKMFPQLIQSKDFEGAIKAARLIKQAANPTPAPKPEDLLNDESFVNEKILTNPQIKEKLLKSHMEEIRKGTPPPQINGNAGGSPPASPIEKPKSLKEAGQRFLSRILS